MDVAYQLGFCLPQSPWSSLEAHSEPIEEPVVQPVEQEILEEPHQVCGQLGTEEAGGLEKFVSPCWEETELPASAPGCERTQALGLPAPCDFGHMTPPLPKPPSSESKQGLQPEPTVNFLFTLLSSVEPPEPKEQQEDLEALESQFLDKEDWGSRRASKEINQLQDACMRLQESMSTIQANNVALKERLQNLPDFVYNILLEELKAVPEEVKAAQEEEQDVQEEEQDWLFEEFRQPHGEW